MSDEKSVLGDKSKKILGSMKKKTFSGEETIAWIKNIEENIPIAAPVSQAQVKQHLTMLTCMDTLFDHFQRYAFEVGQTDASLVLHCERPNYSSSLNRFYGYLSTSNFGLVVEGEPRGIRAFIVPAAFVLDFEARRNDFMSFMELLGRLEDGGTYWEIEGGTIGFDHLPIIAKKLFARLIRVSRGEASELEPFILGLVGVRESGPASTAGAAVAKGASSPAAGGAGAGASGATTSAAASGATASAAASGATASAAASAATASAATTASVPATAVSVEPESMKTVVERVLFKNKSTISAVCAGLPKAIDQEIDILTKTGVQLLHSKDKTDIDLMPRVMKRTESLRNFHRRSQNLIRELGDLFSDE